MWSAVLHSNVRSAVAISGLTYNVQKKDDVK